MKITIIVVFILVALLSVCNSFGSAAEIILHTTPKFDPLKYTSDREPDAGIEIENVTGILNYWNTRLQWGFSQEQIKQLSSGAEEAFLKNYPTTDDKRFHIKNLTQFDIGLGIYIGLRDDQISQFISEDKQQIEKNHQNYHRSYEQSSIVSADLNLIKSDSLLTSVSPSSQSAPNATGKLHYIYIITDFTNPDPEHGSWNDVDRIDAVNDAGYGTWEIEDQAPSNANVVNVESWAHVTNVPGQNTGDYESTWGLNGWTEQAASQFGHGTGSDGRYTTKLAEYIKSVSGADSVILVFFTHDDVGAGAVPSGNGYADRLAVSYWGKNPPYPDYNSEPGSYEHEIVHAYGALDEYIGDTVIHPELTCNFWPSMMAVSPMYEMYKNTNHASCPSSTTRGIMYYPYHSDPYWNEISTAAKNFIGWGDFDGDGTLDPLDGTPYGTGGSGIGAFRSGQWILDYEIDGMVDRRLNFGQTGDKPIVSDFNNDGTTDIGVFRSGEWRLDYGMDGTTNRRFNYGLASDIPVVGDFNNNGQTDIGVFRSGQWILDYEIDGIIDRRLNYGQATDIPVVGDFNNDRITDIGVFRSGQWILDYGMDGTTNRQISYGQATDVPIVGDFNNDRITDIGVFRSGQWILDYGMDRIVDRRLNYGLATDKPLTGKWI